MAGNNLRAGKIYVKINGELRDAKGDYTYNLGKPKRDAIIGADGVHGYKETPQVAFIEGAVTDSDELDLATLATADNVTVTLELNNGKVVTLSGPDGYVYDPDGVCTQEKFDFMLSMRAGGADKVEPYADRFGVEFFPGKRPWEVPVDIVIPCATQNELDVEDAVMIVANNVRYYVEAANMPATAEALKLLRLSPKILTAGAKASGSGGVAVSALEMAQNSIRYNWDREEVDNKLREIMSGIYDASAAAAQEYGLGYDLIAGNDIAAFKKISEAMIAQGL